MSHADGAHGAAFDPWDTLHEPSGPELHWSTSNIGEALPGVPTPLSWSMWEVLEAGTRGGAFAVGALTRAERGRPEAIAERYIRIFYGRPAMSVEYIALLGDRMPGTTGEASVQGLCGFAPDDFVYRPSIKRYPVVAWRLPYTFLTTPRLVRQAVSFNERWYAEQIARVPSQSLQQANATFELAQRRFEEMIVLQAQVLFGSVQPLYGQLFKLIAKAGVGDVGVLSGSGGAEMVGVVGDIWSASRRGMTVEEVARRHGCHGPKEGELSSRVWRENQGPLVRLIAEYAALPDSEDPRLRERQRSRERQEMAEAVVAAVPRSQRPATRLMLRLAAERIPLRGVAKRLFLQAFDVARAAARQSGEAMAADGVIDSPDDVFYLTSGEMIRGLPANHRELIALRRERGAAYEQLTIPNYWKGMPVAQRIAEQVSGEGDARTLTGMGVSSGVVEGVARVVTDPAEDEIASGEILVAPFTDPSWSSVMFISSALVVDIGGPLSHAAVVARELGMPCVVGATHGSRLIRSGDRLRVDGGTGTVEILERAARNGEEI